MNPKINTLVRKFAKTEISEYVVAEGSNSIELSREVYLKLKQGFVLYGDMVAIKADYGWYMFQPMIR